MISVDRRRLSRVLINIIDNASQATLNEGNIWTNVSSTTHKGEPSIKLTIGNSGSPISPSKLEKLFQPLLLVKPTAQVWGSQ